MTSSWQSLNAWAWLSQNMPLKVLTTDQGSWYAVFVDNALKRKYESQKSFSFIRICEIKKGILFFLQTMVVYIGRYASVLLKNFKSGNEQDKTNVHWTWNTENRLSILKQMKKKTGIHSATSAMELKDQKFSNLSNRREPILFQGENKKDIRYCMICRKSFRKRSDAKYCSNYCRYKSWDLRHPRLK